MAGAERDNVSTAANAVGLVIDASYAALSFEAGTTPDTEAFLQCYDVHGLLAIRVFPEDPEVRVLPARKYLEVQCSDAVRQHGYREEPGERSITVLGNVAFVKQDFTMHQPDGRVLQAKDFFSLVARDGQWKIVCVISDFDLES